jgi:hypothetical protein
LGNKNNFMNIDKRSVFILCLIQFSYCVYSQKITYDQTDKHTIVITFEPTALTIENDIIGQDTFVRLISPGAGTTTLTGNPALPVFQQQVLLTLSDVESIEVISKTEEMIQLDYKVIPFFPQKRESINTTQNFQINQGIYLKDSLLPAAFFETGSAYYYAGAPQFDIRFYPVQYNPVKNQLIIIKKTVIKIYLKSARLETMPDKTVNSLSNKLLNSNALQLYEKSRKVFEPPKLLIVTHASLYKQAKEFADWKMRKGIKTIILKTSDISMNPDADQIKTRIIQIHDTFNFDHLLFIGDVSLIPAFYGLDNSLNDHMYSTIEGDDFLADISIGRFPVFNDVDCRMELQKSMNYERYPDITSGNDWFKKATVAASNSYLDNSHGINMVKYFRNAGFDTIDDLRAMIGTFRYDLLQKAFTNGRSWVFYIGHGIATSWSVLGNYSTGSLNYLNNNNMLPVVVSIACLTADLDNPTDCLGEKWLSLGEKRGAVSFIGATELNEFFYSDTLGKHTIFGYFNRSALTIGAALNYGKMQMYNSFQGGAGSLTEETMQQFLLLGDPTLMPWTNIPVPLQTGLKKHRQPIPQIIKFKVTTNGYAVPDALVCMTNKNYSDYQTTYSDSSGYVSLIVNPTNSTTYFLTISGYNLAPLEDSISFDTLNSLPEQIFNADITLYPNPIKDFCTITSHTEGKLIKEVEIIDIHGMIITSYSEINSYTFSFGRNDLKPGIYLIRIKDGSGIYHMKKIAVN